MGVQPFDCKGPHPLSWAGSQVTLGKNSNQWYTQVPKLLCNFYSIYIIYKCGRGPHHRGS